MDAGIYGIGSSVEVVGPAYDHSWQTGVVEQVGSLSVVVRFEDGSTERVRLDEVSVPRQYSGRKLLG